MNLNTPGSTKEPVKVLSQVEQEALIKEEIEKFLKISKEKGTLTIEEINELLPPEIIHPGVLDAFMHALEAGGASILEYSEEAKAEEEAESAFLTDADKSDEDSDEDEKADFSHGPSARGVARPVARAGV